MPERSSYLQYLPAVLWENKSSSSQLSLGRLLRIFEKILTGIDDDQAIGNDNCEYEPIEAVISRLHKLFNPWLTPPEFLEWLASCVSLEFPKVGQEYLWDEYQRRKITADIVQIYQSRGLKEGLRQYLELFSFGKERPRIVIDDGSRLWITDPNSPNSDRPVSITTFLSQGPSVYKDIMLSHEGLIRPQCIAITKDQSLFVGDAGTPDGVPISQNVPEAIWHLSLPDQAQSVGVLPLPQKLNLNLTFPQAIAVDHQDPSYLYILDQVPDGPVVYRFTSPKFDVSETIATAEHLDTINPVAMTVDQNRHLLILDRGNVPNAITPKIIDIDVLPGNFPKPSFKSQNLSILKDPLSLLILPNGDLIIGDGCEQAPPYPNNDPTPGNLVWVNRTNPEQWKLSLLLPENRQQNPLVAPTAIVEVESQRLIILDIGLKPHVPPTAHAFIRDIAQPAGLYAVTLTSSKEVQVSKIESINGTSQMVFPQDMAISEGKLYICDPGDPWINTNPVRSWRLYPHEFGIIVHFVKSSVVDVEKEKQERQRILKTICEIADREKPAHTFCSISPLASDL